MGLSTERQDVKAIVLAAAGFLTLLGAAAPAAWAQSAAPRPADRASAPADPAREAQAKAFVNDLIGQLRATIGRTDLSEAQKQDALEEVFRRNLAVRTMGSILLGSNRSAATPEQLTEYNALIPGYLASSFAGQIDDLVAQNIVLGEVRSSGQQMFVSSSFARRGAKTPVRVVWRVLGQNGRMQLVDASVNGASKLTVQRSEFNSLVKAKGFAGLLEYLRKNG
jgi:ABC-type transporter MlaC component